MTSGHSENKIKTYNCKFLNCEEKFISNDLLEEHRLVHLMCNICNNKIFSTATKLKNHMNMHDADTILYLCPIKNCNKERNIKGFSSKVNMKTHVLSYHIKLCEQCWKAFNSDKEYSTHVCDSS